MTEVMYNGERICSFSTAWNKEITLKCANDLMLGDIVIRNQHSMNGITNVVYNGKTIATVDNSAGFEITVLKCTGTIMQDDVRIIYTNSTDIPDDEDWTDESVNITTDESLYSDTETIGGYYVYNPSIPVYVGFDFIDTDFGETADYTYFKMYDEGGMCLVYNDACEFDNNERFAVPYGTPWISFINHDLPEVDYENNNNRFRGVRWHDLGSSYYRYQQYICIDVNGIVCLFIDGMIYESDIDATKPEPIGNMTYLFRGI